MRINDFLKNSRNLVITVIIAGALLAGLATGLINRHLTLKESRETNSNLTSAINALEENIRNLEYDKSELSEALYSEQSKNSDFEKQIKRISDTVGILDKLSQTDPELLQKYSKVYFLNEHYVPKNLTNIDPEYLLESQRQHQIAEEVWPFLENLLDRAKSRDLDLKVLSGFRSFDTQSALKSNYRVIYGAGTANQFSADQGYSEHQLGTAVDFTTPTIGSTFTGFENSPEYDWLTKNAHRYGFVLSYPPNNAYYQYEPWHWRFVGIDLARRLYDDNQYFYDLDQRTIDQYLISIFDN